MQRHHNDLLQTRHRFRAQQLGDFAFPLTKNLQPPIQFTNPKNLSLKTKAPTIEVATHSKREKDVGL